MKKKSINYRQIIKIVGAWADRPAFCFVKLLSAFINGFLAQARAVMICTSLMTHTQTHNII